MCEHLLRPIILSLDFSHIYLIGINWFSTKQLHLHQGLLINCSVGPHIIPFTHYTNIYTAPLHILVKTNSQVTIPTRTLVTVPTTLTSIPTNNCYYNLPGTQSILDQNLFVVPLLKIFSTKLPTNLLCTVINISPDNVVLPRNRHIEELNPLNHSDTSVYTVTINEIMHTVKQSTINADSTPLNNRKQHSRNTCENQQPLVSI